MSDLEIENGKGSGEGEGVFPVDGQDQSPGAQEFDPGEEGEQPEDELPERVVKNTRETLKVMLTDDEIRELGIQSARLGSLVRQEEADLTAVKSQFKAKIDKLNAERTEVDNRINAGWEMRSIECESVYDYQNHSVTMTRTDTGEIVRSRNMTADEIQRTLF